MEKNSDDGAMISDATIKIKIVTLDSKTYTLQVDKHVSVLALKEEIATVSGVVPEQQRLLFRRRKLENDQLLSAYHVEDGDTLHLVRLLMTPSSETESFLNSPATYPSSSTGNTQARRVTVAFRRIVPAVILIPDTRRDTEEAEPGAANSGVGDSSTQDDPPSPQNAEHERGNE